MAYSNYYAASGLFHGSMSSVMGTQFDLLMPQEWRIRSGYLPETVVKVHS